MENTRDYLIDMLVPSLDAPEYAGQLDEAFQNIKDNFSILANQAFVKGETGDSSNLQIEPLMVDYSGNGDPYLTAYGYNVLNAIYPGGIKLKSDSTATEFPIAWSSFNKFEDGVYEPVSVTIEKADNTIETKTYHWYSQFEALNEDGSFGAGNVYVISKRNGNESIEDATPYSSLYYTFLDYRFYNENVGTIGEDTYEQLEDMSCVLVLHAEENGYSFKKYDAFPTMYYEDNTGLCWRINGSKTGMPVKGAPGDDGKNATLHIVRATATDEQDKYKIVDIFDNGFKELTDINTIKSLNGQSAIIFVQVDTTKNNFYFGKMYLDTTDDDEANWYLYTYCKQDNSLDTQIANNGFINILKAINLYYPNITLLKGLFVPIQSAPSTSTNPTADGDTAETSVTQAVHLIAAVTDHDDASPISENKDLLFTAINDINANVRYDEMDEDAKSTSYDLYIDNYMYLEYDKTMIAAETLSDPEYPLLVGWGSPTTHILKFNRKGYIHDENGNIDYTGYPECLKDIIKTSGIYRWELSNDKAEYDVDELKNAFIDDEYDYAATYVDNSVNPPKPYIESLEDSITSNCPIYTISPNPGPDSKFYWYCPYNNYDSADDVEENNNDGKPGWTSKKFIFRKLVPICVNGSVYDKDTTLNINYNVNVVGDNNSNGSHNLTVHGNISSNSANVDGSISAKDYKNIYTSDVIKGDKGIELGKIYIDDDNNNNVEYAFIVNGDGSITKSSSINSNDITTGTLNASDTVTADNVSCNSFKLEYGDTINVSAEIVNAAKNNVSNINVNNTNNIRLKRNDAFDTVKANIDKKITSDEIPHINSDVPLFLNNNANIVISNATDANDVYMNLSDVTGLPDYFRSDADNGIIDFNSAKDYNLYKIIQDSNSKTEREKCTGETQSSTLPAETDKGKWVYETVKVENNNVDANWAIAKFVIPEKGDTLVNNIRFNLGEYLLRVSVYGRCHYGSWPIMESDSEIRLNYYINGVGPNTLFYTDPTVYKFSNTNTAWYGINHKDKEYGGMDRYYYYKFSPRSIMLGGNSSYFTALQKAYEAGAITIYVVPSVKINFKSENKKDNIKKVSFTGFWNNAATSKTESSTISRTTIKDVSATNKQPYSSTPSNYVKPSCEYYVTTTDNSNAHKSTTICDNGIVFTSGKYVFGLGYAENIYNHNAAKNSAAYSQRDGTNIWGKGGTIEPKVNECLNGEPVLFIADSTSTGVKDWIKSVNSSLKRDTDKEKINFNYNRAINAIPLKDIFEAIKHIRNTNTGDWKKFGL